MELLILEFLQISLMLLVFFLLLLKVSISPTLALSCDFTVVSVAGRYERSKHTSVFPCFLVIFLKLWSLSQWSGSNASLITLCSYDNWLRKNSKVATRPAAIIAWNMAPDSPKFWTTCLFWQSFSFTVPCWKPSKHLFPAQQVDQRSDSSKRRPSQKSLHPPQCK